jgi:phage terminase large subunit-like protein
LWGSLVAKGKTLSPPQPIFIPIFDQDRSTLTTLLDSDMKFSDTWWEFDKHWKKVYGYSLRVQLIFDFIEKLIIPSGKGKGESVILRPFQKSFIKDVYNPVNENRMRIVLRAILSMGRKGGKTFLIACLVLVHLIGPEATNNGEIYSAATEREQAAIVFKYVTQIVKADSELESMIDIVPSTKTMVCYQNGSTYKAVSAEAGTKFGYNPTVVIYDELAQAKNTDLYTAFDTAMGARMGSGEETIFFVISTQSKDPQHILSQLIADGIKKQDPTTVCHLYTVPLAKDNEEDDALTNESKWYLANPALGDFRSLEEMRTFAKKAIRMPVFENEFRNYYLNQCVDAKSPLIPRAEWIGCKGDDDSAKIISGEDIILGLDLSGKTDLTAMIGTSTGEKDKIKSWFWKPKDSIKEHEKRDRVPYVLWERQGFIKTTPGKSIQYSFIAQEIAEISKAYNIIGIAFDRYRIDDLRNAMDGIGLNSYIEKKDKDGNPIIEPSMGIRMVPWGQGYKDMTSAVEALEGSILDRILVHDGHPCLTWNISNAMVISDAAGNRKLDKSQVRFRIDGAVSLAMAIGLKSRDRKGLPQKSGYENLTVDQIMARISI